MAAELQQSVCRAAVGLSLFAPVVCVGQEMNCNNGALIRTIVPSRLEAPRTVPSAFPIGATGSGAPASLTPVRVWLAWCDARVFCFAFVRDLHLTLLGKSCLYMARCRIPVGLDPWGSHGHWCLVSGWYLASDWLFGGIECRHGSPQKRFEQRCALTG